MKILKSEVSPVKIFWSRKRKQIRDNVDLCPKAIRRFLVVVLQISERFQFVQELWRPGCDRGICPNAYIALYSFVESCPLSQAEHG